MVLPDNDNGRVQELGYLDKKDADQRAEHLNKDRQIFEGYEKRAEVWPVNVWVPTQVTLIPEYPPIPDTMVTTLEEGTKIYDVGDGVPARRFSLSGYASAAASRAKARDKLDEARQVVPEALQHLFEERNGQLALFPRDLP